jgi:hypothetical protein
MHLGPYLCGMVDGTPHLPQSADVVFLTLAAQTIGFPISHYPENVTFPPIVGDFAQRLTIPLSQPAKPLP